MPLYSCLVCRGIILLVSIFLSIYAKCISCNCLICPIFPFWLKYLEQNQKSYNKVSINFKRLLEKMYKNMGNEIK